MALTQEALLAALASVQDPHRGKPFPHPEVLRAVRIDGASVSFELALPYPAQSLWPQLRAQLQAAARQVPGVAAVDVQLRTAVVAHSVQRGMQPLPGVKNVIAVASGKGGVGKSTTAVNLALALAAEGAQVGLLDADIYGPSQPMMTGTSGDVESRDGKLMEPHRAMGLQINSIGFLVNEEQAMIWRGPMAS